MTGIVRGKATRPPLPQCPWCGFLMTIRLHDGWGCGWCGATIDGHGHWWRGAW